MTYQTVVQQRQTKYCDGIRRVLDNLSHATNTEILTELRLEYPGLSATTVHRATTRLASRGEIGIAPVSSGGSMRYDAINKPHDHFLCSSCDLLRDMDVKNKVVPILETSLGDCSISGRLSISGVCKQCKNQKELYEKQ
jgi:Fe2+ or Zn2+ uptake regulation protein